MADAMLAQSIHKEPGMTSRGMTLLSMLCIVLVGGCGRFFAGGKAITGPVMQWHTVTLTFDGPASNKAKRTVVSEMSNPNPFLDYRLDVTFVNGDARYVVPGYYAADGEAAQTNATEGNKWRVHFVPDRTGEWTYVVSFRAGAGIAINSDPNVGKPLAFDGAKGRFTVEPTDKRAPDLRGKGMLRYVGRRYLQFAQTGEFFIKAGTDSPENFLAYADFDGTYDTEELTRPGEAAGPKFLHHYEPHVQDWKEGDPTWKDGKGKGMIGALNYLASKGMNSVYFLTYNIDGGDGKDVWPWVAPNDKSRFDCSKLDQWEIVFSHMDKLGLMLHVVTQETENDQALDRGELGPQRKLYYRELIARFGHHLALVWNLGEENSNTDAQRKAFATYIRGLDAYRHPIVCHTFPGQYDAVYAPLLGFPYFEGLSLQTNDTHAQTIKWLDRSAASRKPWFVGLDEIGPAHTGAKPDNDDYWHDEIRAKHLWGNLMAGGAGVEWYFGYQFSNNDLNCENWRSRDHLWDLTRFAVEFFHDYLTYAKMSHHDELTSAPNDYCLAEPGWAYAIYLPAGGTTNLDLGSPTATFRIRWFNPRTGGAPQMGTIASTTGPGVVRIGQPAKDTDKDWLCLVERVEKVE
jgi:hypothetical protein